MAFNFQAYRNPYVSTIAELLSRGEDAKAKALVDVANAQAQAAQVRGQAWGGAVEGIGNIAARAIAEYNDPKAQEARAIEKGQKVLNDRSRETITDSGQRLTPDTRVPGVPYKEFVNNPTVNPVDKLFRNVDFGAARPAVTTQERFSLAQPDVRGTTIENVLQVRPPGLNPRPNATSQDILGQIREGVTLPTGRAPEVETYDKAPRNRYTTAQGLYDVSLAYSDLINAGTPIKVAIALAGQGQQANSIFAAYDKDKEALDQKQIAVRGSIANMALQLMNIQGMSAEDALAQVGGPAGNRLSQDDMNAFTVELHGKKTESEKRQMLVSEVDKWDAQGTQQAVAPGSVLVGRSNRTKQVGIAPVSAADRRESQRQQTYDDAVARGYEGSRDRYEAEQVRGPASLEQQVLTANANGDTAEVEKLLAVEKRLAAARRQPPDPATIAAAGLTRELALARLRQYNDEFDATERSANTRKNLPEGFNAAFGRATLGMPATRRDNFDKTLEDIASRNDPKELLSFLRQAAIEGSPVEQQKLINARIEGVEALGQVKLDLAALRKAGIDTGIVRGGVENIAQALGTTTNPRLAAIAVRITENLIIYRNAITGAQFSEKETDQYESLMPGFSNTFGLNEARINSLLNAWTSREKSFWNVKLSGGWGSRMINDLSGLDLGANFGPS